MSVASSLVFEPTRAVGLAFLTCFVEEGRAGSAYERDRNFDQFKLSESQVIDCASPQAPNELIKGRNASANEHLSAGASVVTSIAVAWMPVGPVRDALSAPLHNLQQQGVHLKYLARQWDASAWPHAKKGFFHLKTKIPELLRTAL